MDFSNLIPLSVGKDDTEGVAPAPFQPVEDVTPDGTVLMCEAGQHEWLHSGRGRKPKDCPEHRVRNSSATTSGRVRSSTRKLDKLKEDLAVSIARVGKPLASPLPITGTIVVTRSTGTADAIVELCKNNDRALAVLEKIGMVAPATELGDLLATLAVSIQVDTNRMPSDHFLAQLTGVTDVAETINRHTQQAATNHQAPAVTGGPQMFTPFQPLL